LYLSCVMADNYLEKRYQEVFGNSGSSKKNSIHRLGIDNLLLKNQSIKGFDPSYKVHRLQLESIAGVNDKINSVAKEKSLRFFLFNQEDEAFIVVCSTLPERPSVNIDLGISLQSMLLKAVDLGLGGKIILDFDKMETQNELNLHFEPLAILVVGKPLI